MASLLTDETWELIKPVLPERPPHPSGGRPPVGDREVLTGVLMVLKTGIRWEDLPEELGCGCGRTCFRRLKEWHSAGVWPQIQEVLRMKLRDADRFDWSRAALNRRRRVKRATEDGNGFEPRRSFLVDRCASWDEDVERGPNCCAGG